MKNNISKIIPLLTVLIALFAVILIPFQIIGYGFLPPDDAMRHAAKVISGKEWNQILVLRPEIKMDSHAGWHAILGSVHKVTGWDAHSLVLFSVIALFMLFAVTPLFFVRYPESWLIALLIFAIATPGTFFRLFLGRPYIVTMAVLLVLCFSWPRLREKKVRPAALIGLTLLVAASTWIHCGWYLFILPITALLIAREWRSAAVFSACAVSGVVIGAALTGHPVMFLKQTLMHLFLAFGNNDAEHQLVGEFRPGFGDFNVAVVVAAIVFWQAPRGRWNRKTLDNPVFILGFLSFFLVLLSRRVWLDWGFPAAAAWVTLSFEEFFGEKHNLLAWRRVIVTSLVAAALYLCITSDVGSRWTQYKPVDYISAENPKQAVLLPEPGGIIYSSDMGVFYQIFFMNPHADWRYILGFEPALMPKDDLAILRNIQRSPWTFEPYYGWIKKMRPEDRLIIKIGPASPPRIPDLEWNYAALNTWIGRLPRK